MEQNSPTRQSVHTPSIARFGGFELDLRTAELRKNGHKIRLQEQPFQILVELLERRGEVVLREEIRRKLWPNDTIVEFDHSINAAVKRLRDSLGDSAENARYIETLARRGYRFIAPVSWDPAERPQPEVPPSAPYLSAPAPAPEEHTEAAVQTRVWPGRGAIVALFIVGLAVLAATILLLRRSGTGSPAELRVAPLTSNTGLELQPALSPDGTRVAYAWRVQPQSQSAIYVKLIGPGDPVKMTKDLPRVFSPAWSPDGRWIAALQDLGRVGVIVLIPALGGQPKELARVTKADPGDDACVGSDFPFICGANSFGSLLAWSRDGQSLFTAAQVEPNSPPAIVRVSVETGEVHPLTSPPKGSAGDFGPAVSPNGQQLAFLRLRSVRTGDLYVTSLPSGRSSSAGQPRQITTDGADTMSPAWTPDGRELIFSSDRSGRRELWRVLVSGGKPIRLAGVGEDALDVAVSHSGGTLIYTRGRYSGSLWKIPITAHRGGDPVRVTSTTARDKFSHLSPDGKRIAFESGRSGVDEIWVCDSDGSNAVQLTTFGKGISGSPRWSPDGRMIAFDSNVAGTFNIYVVPAGGGRPVRLTDTAASAAIPIWSRDSQWIYFTSARTGRAEVWKIRAAGGPEIQVTRDGGSFGTESADGRYLYFVRDTEHPGDLFRMPVNGGHATKVLSSVEGRLFTVFPHGIYFATGSPQAELRYLKFATGSVRTIAPLPGIPLADVSSDEHWALYPRPTMSDTNLMVVENFR